MDSLVNLSARQPDVDLLLFESITRPPIETVAAVRAKDSNAPSSTAPLAILLNSAPRASAVKKELSNGSKALALTPEFSAGLPGINKCVVAFPLIPTVE